MILEKSMILCVVNSRTLEDVLNTYSATILSTVYTSYVEHENSTYEIKHIFIYTYSLSPVCSIMFRQILCVCFI
jgi:hypothetical protein